jgi:hypothetical protein
VAVLQRALSSTNQAVDTGAQFTTITDGLPYAAPPMGTGSVVVVNGDAAQAPSVDKSKGFNSLLPEFTNACAQTSVQQMVLEQQPMDTDGMSING